MNLKKSPLWLFGLLGLSLLTLNGCSSDDPQPLEPPTQVLPPEPVPDPKPEPEPEPVPVQKRLKTFHYETANGSGATFTYTYNEQGLPQTIDNGMGTAWTFTYGTDEITTLSATQYMNDNSKPTLTFKLQDGRISQSIVYVGQLDQYITYQWHYNADGYLTQLVGKFDADVLPSYTFPMEQTYACQQLTAFNFNRGMTQGELSYGTAPTALDFPAIEPVYLFYMNHFLFDKEDFFVGKLLNLAGHTSPQVPQSLKVTIKPLSDPSGTTHIHSFKASKDQDTWTFEKDQPLDEYDTSKVVYTAETY